MTSAERESAHGGRAGAGAGELPHALRGFGEIASRLAGAQPVIFIDYDGTLSPIRDRPGLATLPAETRAALARLAARFPVAVVSGRVLADVSNLVGLSALTYAGDHGFDIAGPPLPAGGAPLRYEADAAIPAEIQRVAAELEREVGDIPGVLVEPKRFALAVHYRLAPSEALPRIERAVDAAAARHTCLRKTGGKMVFELRPRLEWHKGKAVEWLLPRLAPGGPRAAGAASSSHTAGAPPTAVAGLEDTPGAADPPVVPLYIGDDVTDEDGFRAAVGAGGMGILVAEEPRATAATWRLRDPDEVRDLLRRLGEL